MQADALLSNHSCSFLSFPVYLAVIKSHLRSATIVWQIYFVKKEHDGTCDKYLHQPPWTEFPGMVWAQRYRVSQRYRVGRPVWGAHWAVPATGGAGSASMWLAELIRETRENMTTTIVESRSLCVPAALKRVHTPITKFQMLDLEDRLDNKPSSRPTIILVSWSQLYFFTHRVFLSEFSCVTNKIWWDSHTVTLHVMS